MEEVSNMLRYWIFQDESGSPAKDDFFIVGLLGMTPLVKRRLIDSVKSVRDAYRFYDELHFQKFSNLRSKVYKEVLDEAFKCYFTYRAIVVRKSDVKLSLFGNKEHLAYNKFTELVLYSLIKNRTEDIHIRPDEKSRMIEDNFYDYLVRNLNFKSFSEGHSYTVKSCKSTSSGDCDVIQVCDLITGVVKNKYSPAGERKNEVGTYILNKHASKINIWDWKPKK